MNTTTNVKGTEYKSTLMGVLQTENLYFENSETKTTQQSKIFSLNTKSINKQKSINLTRFLNLSVANLNLALLKNSKKESSEGGTNS